MDSEISHTYIRLDDSFLGTSLIFNADLPGIVIVYAPYFDAQNVAVEEYEIDDPRIEAAVKNHFRLLGKKYDFVNLFGWAWVITFKRWFKKKMLNPIDDPKKLICVDFVLKITNDAGITPNLPIGQMTPAMLHKWFESNYKECGWKKIELANKKG